jgi:hypothetical protein
MLLVLTAASPALAQTKRQLSAHEHGKGTLSVAVDGGTLALDLEAPGMDIVGFEREAKSQADKAKIADAVRKLEKAGELFVLPTAAGCILATAKAGLKEDDDHDAKAGAQAHDEHTEFAASYTFTCTAPGALTSIGLEYFKVFPGAQRLTVTVVSGTGQSQTTVTRAKPQLAIKP